MQRGCHGVVDGGVGGDRRRRADPDPDDFGLDAASINLVFAGSGCLGTLDDLRAGRLPSPIRPGGAELLHPAADEDWLPRLESDLPAANRGPARPDGDPTPLDRAVRAGSAHQRGSQPLLVPASGPDVRPDRTRSHSSRTAPRPPRLARCNRASRTTSGRASATATGQPTRFIGPASLMSLPR